MLRRSEKKIKDANLQAEEERRTADQYKEQVPEGLHDGFMALKTFFFQNIFLGREIEYPSADIKESCR